MTLIQDFSENSFYLGGFSAFTRYLDKKTAYSHVFTDLPLHEAVIQVPQIKIGLGETFDGILEQDGHCYLFYFAHDLSDFQDFKREVENRFEFNQQGFFYDFGNDRYLNCLNSRFREKTLFPLRETVDPDSALEAILISLLGGIPLELTKTQVHKKAGSFFLFRKVVEEFFSHGLTFQGFAKLIELDLISVYLPELADLEGINHDKDYHPEGDALEHTLECLKYFHSKNQILGWSIILHDLGKALAEKSGKRRFDNHAQLGVDLARRVLSRMLYPADFQEKVLFLVEHHMHPIFIPYMDDREKENLLSHPLSKELLQLFKVDIMGSHKNMEFYNRIKTLLARSSV